MKKETFTKVTPLSKIIALTIFIFFPFLGFFGGYYYGKSVSNVKCEEAVNLVNDSFQQETASEETVDTTIVNPNNTPISELPTNVVPPYSVTGEFYDPRLDLTFILPEGWSAYLSYFPDGFVMNAKDAEKFDCSYYSDSTFIKTDKCEDFTYGPLIQVTLPSGNSFSILTLSDGIGFAIPEPLPEGKEFVYYDINSTTPYTIKVLVDHNTNEFKIVECIATTGPKSNLAGFNVYKAAFTQDEFDQFIQMLETVK
jgi:hypothetical protein